MSITYNYKVKCSNKLPWADRQ